METINIKNKEIQIKSELNDISIDDFTKMMTIYQSDDSEVEKLMEIVELLSDYSLTKEDIEEFDMDDLYKFSSMIKNDEAGDILDHYYLNDIKYNLQGDSSNFKFKVGQINKIYKSIKENPTDYLDAMMAIIYTNNGVEFEKRKELFRTEMTMDIVMPFIKLLQTQYTNNA